MLNIEFSILVYEKIQWMMTMQIYCTLEKAGYAVLFNKGCLPFKHRSMLSYVRPTTSKIDIEEDNAVYAPR
jgi:hypothetical protein